ncbi:RpiB/LacA/LacB family sugar-phosphate isomerase [Candidatus Kaiserbacteria bacterium]|nr:RpiB/LacA/LacB family sugar-phosphate isomerase [Candidatus Kaiserbacteria bacterium]
MKIYFAADHAGFELKNTLIEYVRGFGHEVEDCGAFAFDKEDDYPAFIAAAAKKLSTDSQKGIESRAIVIGASGQGEAIVANRYKGVRCALYYGETSNVQTDMSGTTLDILSSSRQHNNANALSLGARFIDTPSIGDKIKLWLETPFSGEERHVRRIKQIDEVS